MPLAEIYYERENEYTLAGSIYNGRVTAAAPSENAGEDALNRMAVIRMGATGTVVAATVVAAATATNAASAAPAASIKRASRQLDHRAFRTRRRAFGADVR